MHTSPQMPNPSIEGTFQRPLLAAEIVSLHACQNGHDEMDSCQPTCPLALNSNGQLLGVAQTHKPLISLVV
jgi:hypothetical protein